VFPQAFDSVAGKEFLKLLRRPHSKRMQ
jgi:hypothetical protein